MKYYLLRLILGVLFYMSGAYVKAMEVEEDKKPLIYGYFGGACTTDGVGDIIHGKRFLRCLSIEKTWAFFEFVDADNQIKTCLETPFSAVMDQNAKVVIICSYFQMNPARVQSGQYLTFFSEYGRVDLESIKGEIRMSLGLVWGLGYMPPLLPIDLLTTQEEIFQKWTNPLKKIIYGDGTPQNTLVVLGYLSPLKDFSSKVLNAFSQSPYAQGKNLILFLKGKSSKIQEMRKEVGRFYRVETTEDRVPDEDWHALSHLADIMICTGDSSFSDTFFFRNLPFWTVHKGSEAKALFMVLTDWEASPKVSNKGKLIEYVSILLLDTFSLRESELINFVEKIDHAFMEDWKKFCAYLVEKYTLDSKKVSTVIETTTRIHLAKDSFDKKNQSGTDLPPEFPEDIKELLDSSTLPEESKYYLKAIYRSKFNQPFDSTFCKRMQYFIRMSDSWK